jgi:hypothetical protein
MNKMNTVKDREPFNTVVNITTTATQKRTLEEHAKQFNTSVSEVLREIIDVWTNDPMAVILKDFAQKKYDDNVTLSYNLFRAIITVLQAGEIHKVNKELVADLQKIVDRLQENIAIGMGEKIKEWKQTSININPN